MKLNERQLFSSFCADRFCVNSLILHDYVSKREACAVSRTFIAAVQDRNLRDQDSLKVSLLNLAGVPSIHWFCCFSIDFPEVMSLISILKILEKS